LAGVDNNLDFLRDLLETPAVRAGKVSTRFVGSTSRPCVPEPSAEADRIDSIAAALAWVLEVERSLLHAAPPPWDRLGAWRVIRRCGHRGWTPVALRAENGESAIVRVSGSQGHYEVETSSAVVAVEAWWSSD